MDYVSDSLGNGQVIRALTVVDNFSRVSPAIEVDFSMTGTRVVEVLERVRSRYGQPLVIKCDNGPEFISRAVDCWAYKSGVKLEFSRPGKPTDNAFIESFNGRLRQECLDQHWFESLGEARRTIEKWRKEYNEARPHSALSNETPEAFKKSWQQARGPTGQTPVIRSDNGLIFQSLRFREACRFYRLKQEYITPYTPEQNGLIEGFFRSLKEECVWQHNFDSFSEASEKVRSWICWYNEGRPHQVLGYRSPVQFRRERLLAA